MRARRAAIDVKPWRGLQHQRSGKILRRKAGIEVAEHDLVDVFGLNAGVGQRFAGHFHDQAFHGFAGKLAEGGMRPTHDAGCHVALLAEFRTLLLGCCVLRLL
jgi:hypothetical protein